MKVFALILSLAASPLSAQTVSYSLGLFNAGKVAQERTHHVRMGAMGRDLYFGLGLSWKHVEASVRVLPTALHVWPCDSVPCETISRWSSRPQKEGHAEPLLLTVAGVGFKGHYRWVQGSVGPSLSIISAGREWFYGAVPMMVAGAYAKLRIGPKPVGLEIAANAVPRQPARFVVLDEYGGGKTNGRPYTEKQKVTLAVYAGVSISAR